MPRYIKLTKATSSHSYQLDYYSADGTFLSSSSIKLKDLDKLTSSSFNKIRINSPWAIISQSNTLLPVGLPKFLR